MFWTSARFLLAACTRPRILSRDRPGKVDIEQVGETRRPRQDIRELLLQAGALTTPHGLREFTDLLHEPEERVRHAARPVLFEIELSDMFLELRDGQPLKPPRGR